MNIVTPKADVGVIVARFQCPDLSEAHQDLIQSVVDRHKKVIVFLGLSPCKTTQNNPLDFEARKQMVLTHFPQVNVLYIKDEFSDESWSKKLDNQIRDLLGPNQTAILYGGRDSFLPHYKGKFPTIELAPDHYVSGTQLRKEAAVRAKNSADFRAGVIWAVENQFPSCYPTVDIAIIDGSANRLLLGRKPGEPKFRFVGGFADVDSRCYEDDARREVMEETRLELGELKYLGSFLLDDWRYRSERNKCKTLFFRGEYLMGPAIAADDICEVEWFKLDKITTTDIMPVHIPLLERLLSHE